MRIRHVRTQQADRAARFPIKKEQSSAGLTRRRGMPVAERTGHTIVDSIRVYPFTRYIIVGVTLATLLGAIDCLSAAQPGARSRRNVQQHTDKQPSRGLLNLKSVFSRGENNETKSADQELLDSLPMERLTHRAKETILTITDRPTLKHQLPPQQIRCDGDLFLFLTRHPETIVGIWDLMGITQVKTKRTGPYEFQASDGCGTTCQVDLLYGDRNLHIFVADGMYDGKYAQKPITGKGVFILKSKYFRAPDGSMGVSAQLDCYIKFDNFGADLLARSLRGLIDKSADHNFSETAKFISQISYASETSTAQMLEIAGSLPQVDPPTKSEFKKVISSVAIRRFDAASHSARRSPVDTVTH